MTLIELYYEGEMYLVEAMMHLTIKGAAIILWNNVEIPLYKSDDPDGWVVVGGYEEELEGYLNSIEQGEDHEPL